MNIDKLILSDENPLISVVRLKDSERVQRGMAFVYKKLSRKIKVVVTCKHNFIKHSFEDFEFFLGGKKNPLSVISPPFYHPNKSHDIVFFIVQDLRRYQTAEFILKSKISHPYNGQTLYNSKCDFNPDIPNFPFYVMCQQTYEPNMCWGVKEFETKGESVKPENEIRKNELIEKGYVIYPSIGMRSVVGCSGSPIFDSDLNLYGMNVRGIDGRDELIYVPVSEINNIYSKFLPEIKKYSI